MLRLFKNHSPCVVFSSLLQLNSFKKFIFSVLSCSPLYLSFSSSFSFFLSLYSCSLYTYLYFFLSSLVFLAFSHSSLISAPSSLMFLFLLVLARQRTTALSPFLTRESVVHVPKSKRMCVSLFSKPKSYEQVAKMFRDGTKMEKN